MKGDFTRFTDAPEKNYSRVMMQQGRVLVDADWNEQTSILLRFMRQLAVDIIGPHGGPVEGPDDDGGFKVTPTADAKDLQLSAGVYYVDGIRVCAEQPLLYSEQDRFGPDSDYELGNHDAPFLVYLDVWERHINHHQDPAIRDVALLGADTATRAQQVWQARSIELEPDASSGEIEMTCDHARLQLEHLALAQRTTSGRMRATAGSEEPDDDPCVTPPDAKYRGVENQLYRVEIHDGGEAGAGTATFKWSRDNGSAVYGVVGANGSVVTLENLGRDDRSVLKVGDYVEYSNDKLVLYGDVRPLCRVIDVDAESRTVTLELAEGVDADNWANKPDHHPILRRWDHQERKSEAGCPEMTDGGVLKLVEGGFGQDGDLGEDYWLKIEDGISIYFQSTGSTTGHRYRSGDYWLIPARTETGDIVWPDDEEVDAEGKPPPSDLPPHGVQHHYAPLAIVTPTDGSLSVGDDDDCRRLFESLGKTKSSPQ